MGHYLNISANSFQFSKNLRPVHIQCSHGNDLQGYRNFGLPKLAFFLVFLWFGIKTLFLTFLQKCSMCFSS